MEVLTAFEKTENLKLHGNLQILSPDSFAVSFEWQDPEAEIQFAKSPEAGRHFNLWQQTCFELFIRPDQTGPYFEINVSPKGAWNVYQFQDYRAPQPPKEFPGAELLELEMKQNRLTANFHLKGTNLSNCQVSLCAVLFLSDGRSSYWSTRHAGRKPDFHHPDSFVVERKFK